MQYREGNAPHEGGYGRGWREPKEHGWWRRFKQVMREPASKTTWYIATAVLAFGGIAVNAFVAWLKS